MTKQKDITFAFVEELPLVQTCSFLSFGQLRAALEKAFNCKEKERIVLLKVSENGITATFEGTYSV